MKDLLKLAVVIFVIMIILDACFGSSDYEDNDEIKDNTLSYVSLEISYSKKDYLKHAVYHVFVDDEDMGKIETGKRKYFEMYLTKGKHKVFVKSNDLFSNNKSSSETFEVSSGHEYVGYKIKEGHFIAVSLEEIPNDKE